MRYILFGNFVEEDVNSVFWNLKRIGNGMGDVLNEFLLLLRSSPWKQTDLNGGHLFLLSIPLTLPLSPEGRGWDEGVMV